MTKPLFKKGNIPWNKGKKGVQKPYWLGKTRSPETNKKISETKRELYAKGLIKPWNKGAKGKREAWNKGLPKEMQPNYGKTLSEETKKKIGIANSGSRNGRFGKPALNRGITHSEETKKILSQKIHELFATGKLTAPFKGKTLYPETKEKISEKLKELHKSGVIAPYFKNHKMSEKTKELIREERKKQVFPSKDTIIEQTIQHQLEKAGIEYDKHKPIKLSSGRYHQADILLEPHSEQYKGVVIEADGDYWHNRPEAKERDKAITSDLFNQGYYVMRLPEKHIKDKEFDVIPYIEEIMPTEHLKKRRLIKV